MVQGCKRRQSLLANAMSRCEPREAREKKESGVRRRAKFGAEKYFLKKMSRNDEKTTLG